MQVMKLKEIAKLKKGTKRHKGRVRSIKKAIGIMGK